MPGFDGKGPLGAGPITGSGRGYCIIREPAPGKEEATGFAGLAGEPVGQSPTPAGSGTPASKAVLPASGGKPGRFLYLSAMPDMIAPASWPCRWRRGQKRMCR